jgi:hypothetical protein
MVCEPFSKLQETVAKIDQEDEVKCHLSVDLVEKTCSILLCFCMAYS